MQTTFKPRTHSMQNLLFLYLFLSILPLSPLNAQAPLQQGTVHYRISSGASPNATDTTSLLLLFSTDAAALSITTSQDPGSGTFLVLNYKLGQSQGFLYANGDTTPTALTYITPDPSTAKRYNLKLSSVSEKKILGYPCTYFILTPKGGNKKLDRISGWITDRIKTKAVPVTELQNQLPGFPLELSLRDGSSEATILFEADQISPLDTALLQKYCAYMQAAGIPKAEVARQATQAFYNDTTGRLRIPVLPGWAVVENTNWETYLRNDALKATVRLQRRMFTNKEDLEPQLEKVVVQGSRYLQDVLRLPVPAFEGLSFQDRPALQRTWRYSNARNYIFRLYFNGQNPYDYFPLADLVEMQRVFLLKDVLYELQVQTVPTNYETVLQAVENMLAQAASIGQ